MKAVISLSGGLDSTCLLMYLLANGYDEIRAYSFDYGQKHAVELKKVKKNIKFLQRKGHNVTHQIINLRDVFSESASSLHKGGPEVPEGYYNSENMKSTVVENRNVIFSSIVYGKALGWANKTGDDVKITLGIHSGDHCLTGDTLVSTIDGLKQIKDIQNYDVVFTLNHEDKMAVNSVTNAFKVGTVDKTLLITTEVGSLRATEDHKIYRVDLKSVEKGGWGARTMEIAKAKEIKVGDYLFTTSAIKGIAFDDIIEFGDVIATKVLDIKEIEEPVDVYDLTIDQNHNFFAGEHGNIFVHNCIYPDCRPESQEAAEHLFKISNNNSEAVDYIAPFEHIDKGEVLKNGLESMKKLGFTKSEQKKVLKNTHTCYNPDEKGRSCGKCGSCTERLEAFEKNGIEDPIEYQTGN